MEKKGLERYYLIACFMIFLVVSIPIAASNAYGAVSIKTMSVSGEDGIEGYKTLEDSTVIETMIEYDDGNNITPNRVRSLESGLEFNTCENFGNKAICLYERADYPASSGVTRDIQIGVYDEDNHLQDSESRKLSIDDRGPLVAVDSVEQGINGVFVTLDIQDKSCDDCDLVNTPCSGVRDVIVYVGSNTQLQPALNIPAPYYSLDFNQNPSGEHCMTPHPSKIEVLPEEGAVVDIVSGNKVRLKILNPEVIGDGWHTISASAIDHLGNPSINTISEDYEFDFSAPDPLEVILYKYYGSGSQIEVDYVTPMPVDQIVAVIKIKDSTFNPSTDSVTADFSDLFDAPGSEAYAEKHPILCAESEITDVWECRFTGLVIALASQANVEIPVTVVDQKGNVGENTLFYSINVDLSQPSVEDLETRFVTADTDSGDQCWRGTCFLKPGNNTIVAIIDEQGAGMDSHYVVMDLSQVHGSAVHSLDSVGDGHRAEDCIQSSGRWDCMFPVGVIHPQEQFGDEDMPDLLPIVDLNGRVTYYLSESVCLDGDSVCVDEDSLRNSLNSDVLVEQGIVVDDWGVELTSSLAETRYVEVGLINNFLGDVSEAYISAEYGDEPLEESTASLPVEHDYLSHVYVKTIEGYDDAEQPLLNDDETFVYDAMPPKLVGVDAVTIRGQDATDYEDMDGAENVILEGDGLKLLFYFEEDYYMDNSQVYLNLTNPAVPSRSLISAYNDSNFAIMSPEQECDYVEALNQWVCGFMIYNVENTVKMVDLEQELSETSFVLHVADKFGNYGDFKFEAQVFAFNKSFNLSNYPGMFEFGVTNLIPESIDRRTTIQLSQKLMAYVHVKKNYLEREEIDIVRGGISLVPGCPSNPIFVTEEDSLMYVSDDEDESEGTNVFNNAASFGEDDESDEEDDSDEESEDATSAEDIMAVTFDTVIEDVSAFGLIYDPAYNYSDFSLFIRTKKLENPPDISHVILNCSFDVFAASKKIGVFFPKQTFDLKFDINMSHDPVTDDLSEALINKLKGEIEYLNMGFYVLYIINKIFNVLRTICDLGGVLKMAYQAVILLRELTMPLFIAIYNIAEKADAGGSVAKGTQDIWDYINLLACKLKEGKLGVWSLEKDRNAILGSDRKVGDGPGTGTSDRVGGTRYGALGWVEETGSDIWGSQAGVEDGDDKKSWGNIIRSICGVVTCAQCTAEDDIGGHAQDTFETWLTTGSHNSLSEKGDLGATWTEGTQGGIFGTDAHAGGDSTDFGLSGVGSGDFEDSAAREYREGASSATDNDWDAGANADSWLSGMSGAGGGIVGDLFAKKALDPFDNFYAAVMCFCIPGILYHLNKLRQIDCKYLECAYYQSINVKGIQVCEEIRSMEVCLAWTSGLWQLVPFSDVFENLMALVAMFTHSWPTLVIMAVKTLLACNTIASDVSTGGDDAGEISPHDMASAEPDCRFQAGAKKGQPRAT
ncbi:hypothetical protein HOB85_01010, partial [Candidatus Woesearchaeota archaeon]|nr:hypothetical protein [Candidatus Woesearchaeota archaeon]